MNYRPLGNSGLMVSELGFGCMSLGDREEDNTRLINRALDLGINFFDTADLYGNGMNERMLGRALKGRRDEALIATKVGNQLIAGSPGDPLTPAPVWNPGRDYIIKAVEKSLERLQTDRIDLYQLHGGTLEDPIDETISAFETLKEQGKILHYGISSIRPAVIREWTARSRMVSVMMQYSLLDRRPEENCLELLGNAGIGVLARGCLARGLLVGKPPAAYLDYSCSEVEGAAAAIHSLSGKFRSPGQAALQFVLSHTAISSAIVGFRTPGQLEDLAKTYGIPLPGKDEMQVLRESIPPNRYELHR